MMKIKTDGKDRRFIEKSRRETQAAKRRATQKNLEALRRAIADEAPRSSGALAASYAAEQTSDVDGVVGSPLIYGAVQDARTGFVARAEKSARRDLEKNADAELRRAARRAERV